jgi:hypothetical protein
MKTNMLQMARTAGLAVLISAGAASAYAEDAMAANDKTSSGTITALDAKGKVLKIRGFMFSRSFVLGDNCTLALDDKTAASLGDFRPGQKVTVSYQDADGVLVADRVTQDRLFFAGEVTAIDGKNRALSVRYHGEVKSFAIADNCGITRNNNASGTLDDIKPGSRVVVTYETPDGHWTAREIGLPSLHFTGTLGAINLADRTVSISKPLLGEKQFHIADGCAVVINGKVTTRLQNLHAGENCELNDDGVNGVNIVNRIAPVVAQEKAETAEQTTGPATAPMVGN